MAETAIHIENVSKRFRLYHEKYTSLKERAIHFGRSPHEDFWALRDVSFEVYQGETVGLVGHNGSGKSTLLKCVAGIMQPSSGQILSRGRMAAMLELGAGFHPDLTGRENVYLNASLLGLPKRYVDAKFDEIVAFAELEPFIDNQVKYYSSGMYVRLGFAVAVNMDPEILLVDEVLAVGDELFQRKCLDQVAKFQKEGRTIVVVSHSTDLVRDICTRAAVFDQGKLIALDEPEAAVRQYRIHLYASKGLKVPTDAELDSELRGRDRDFRVRVTDVRMRNTTDANRSTLQSGDALDIECLYDVNEPLDDVVFGFALRDEEGAVVFTTNTEKLDMSLGAFTSGTGSITFHLGGLPLLEGTYFIDVAVHDSKGEVYYDWHDREYQFRLTSTGRSEGIVNVPVSATIAKNTDAANAR